jgi:hypothetical protein
VRGGQDRVSQRKKGAHRSATIGALIAVSVLWPPVASPHVAPSELENNRYLKLSPAADGVRLVYTVYMGQQPGAEARRAMDLNGDGLLDQGEADRQGAAVADAVRRALEVTVDGRPYPLDWSEVHVGLGTPEVAAGAFAIDLVTWLCTGPGTEHSVTLHDRFEVPRPGETELRLEPAPGIDIERSTLGTDGRHSQLHFRWLGGPGPMAELGYHLRYRIEDGAAGSSGGACATEPGEAGDDPKIKIAAALAAAIALLLLGWLVLRRRTGR